VLAAEVLTRLRIKGIGLAIDDFGTGHSSLLSLMRLPFTELKIDKSFVVACEMDMEAWKIIRATISLAHELGMSVVLRGSNRHDRAPPDRGGLRTSPGLVFRPGDAGGGAGGLAGAPGAGAGVTGGGRRSHRSNKEQGGIKASVEDYDQAQWLSRQFRNGCDKGEFRWLTG